MIKFVVIFSFLVPTTLVAAGVAAAATVTFSDSKLRCDGVIIRPLMGLESDSTHPCNQLEAKDLLGKTRLHILTMVTDCLCNLVGQQMVWQAMVDDNVENMFSRITALLDPKSHCNNDEVSLLTKLDKFASKHPGDSFRDKYVIVSGQPSEEILKTADKFLTKVCKKLDQDFGELWKYMHRALSASENPRLGSTIAIYDRNLFKALVVWKSCRAMGKIKRLSVWQLTQ